MEFRLSSFLNYLKFHSKLIAHPNTLFKMFPNLIKVSKVKINHKKFSIVDQKS